MPRLLRLPALLLAFLALTAVLVAAGREALDPNRVPSLPSQPPPPIVVGPQAPDPDQARGAHQQMQAAPGWQILCFPVGRLEAVRGLPRMLLRRGPAGLEAVDPVNHPEQVDSGQAYLAWFDQPGLIEFAGTPDDRASRSIPLYAGWNLVGCPADHAIRRETVTVTRPGGTTARVAEVVSPATTPSEAWIYSIVYGFHNGQWGAGDLRSEGDLFDQTPVGLVFCWTEMELNWNQAPPPGGVPTLQRVVPASASPGQTVTVTGQALGQPGRGVLTLSGLPVQPEDILSWSPTQVKFRVPPGATSGRLEVMVDRYPGNSLPLAVALQAVPPPTQKDLAPTTGSLVGQVVSSEGGPLANAQIHLDDGQHTLSDSQGAFRLDNLEPGTMRAYITFPGYKSASGVVQVTPGTPRTLQVSLSPTSGAEVGARSAEQTGTFTITAYPFAVGQEQRNRYWVYRIECWEYGNYQRRWTNTWWTDVGDASFDLKCPGALLGRSYAVIVTWHNRLGDERTYRWTPEFQSDGQTMRYYNPLGSKG